jgi:hypothetical protein
MFVKVARWTRTEGGPRAKTLARIATSAVRLRAQPRKTDRRIETPDGARMDAEADQVRMTTPTIVEDVVPRTKGNESRRDADVPTSTSASLGVARLKNVTEGPTRKLRPMSVDVIASSHRLML